MAKLNGAAGFIWVAVIAVLGLGMSPGTGQLVPGENLVQFLAAFPPVRIVYKKSPSLSVTVGPNNNVFLSASAPGNFNQRWSKVDKPFGSVTANGDGCRKPFALVNVIDALSGQAQAIVSPIDDGSFSLTMAPYDGTCVPVAMLWVQGQEPSDDGFFQIKVLRDEKLVLDGAGGSVDEGTPVLAFPAQHQEDNILWNIIPFA